MRPITMERVETTRRDILDIITSPTLTHEQKLTNLAGKADSLLEVLDLPEGLEELLEPVAGKQCICDLFEGHAPMRPRYIVPDYEKFMKVAPGEFSEDYAVMDSSVNSGYSRIYS